MSAAPVAALTILSFLGAARAQAQEQASLPEGNAYVRSLLAEQRKQDEAINDFSYDLEETREKLNKKGEVTSTTSLRYQVYFVKARQIRRLISRNGVPLSPKEQAGVDARASERARDIRAGKIVTELVGVRLSSLFSSFDFKTLWRTEASGRPVIELEFRPGADRPRQSGGVGVNDRVLKMLTGRVTIDELDSRVVRLEARSDEHLSARVATGVKLGAIDFSVEFLRLGDQIWLPQKIVTYATGRAFLFVTFRVRQTSTYSSYQSFKVDTEERAVR